jgi:hypothetical protein
MIIDAMRAPASHGMIKGDSILRPPDSPTYDLSMS